MTDDIERQLDDIYRKLDRSARRVEEPWKGQTRKRVRPVRSTGAAPWIAAGVAAAAAIVLVVLASSSTREPAAKPSIVKDPPKPVPPPPERAPDLKPEPKPELKPAPAPEPPVRPPDPRPEPKPEPPKPEPKPPVDTTPEPPKPVERAFAMLAETDGAFELAGRKLRGPQKDVKVSAGDKLKAETVAKLVLADNRFLLLAPRTQVEFAPEPERLRVSLEQGEVLAELVGAGPAVRIATKVCEVDHVGTVFSVRVEGERTIVVVEEGRVACRGTTLGAGQQATVTAEKIAVAEADLRRLSWTRGHRAPERALYEETFDAAGAWEAVVANGSARSVPEGENFAAKVRLDAAKPLFHVPSRGRITLVYRADRAAKLTLQLFLQDKRLNFLQEAQVVRTAAWKTLTFDVDKFIPTDKSKRPMALPVGSPVSEIFLQYGEAGERIGFEVDSITVTEVRP